MQPAAGKRRCTSTFSTRYIYPPIILIYSVRQKQLTPRSQGCIVIQGFVDSVVYGEIAHVFFLLWLLLTSCRV